MHAGETAEGGSNEIVITFSVDDEYIRNTTTLTIIGKNGVENEAKWEIPAVDVQEGKGTSEERIWKTSTY